MNAEYRRLLSDPRWQKLSCEIKIRDGWACLDCRSGLDGGKPLVVHHIKYTPGAKPWEEDPANLLTLCDECHLKRHGQKWIPADQYAARMRLFRQKFSIANAQMAELLILTQYLLGETEMLKIVGDDMTRKQP